MQHTSWMEKEPTNPKTARPRPAFRLLPLDIIDGVFEEPLGSIFGKSLRRLRRKTMEISTDPWSQIGLFLPKGKTSSNPRNLQQDPLKGPLNLSIS